MQITENIASSGQPNESEFTIIADVGYDVIINLAMPNSENAIPFEGHLVTTNNMIYIHIPVPFDAPKLFHLQSFINIMESFSDKKVWVHCVKNYRASAFLYHYLRKSHGFNITEAQKAILQSWEPNEIWQQFMNIDFKLV
ncbi:MAG: protein tyrosine phosphatase family protein [Sulfuricurvum sp.]|uniref:protein tyrosine phosphatase family protein n=1 Tax=Sulfuricurvum sp. TaxID=2025608 RepID=UPI0026296187|nr:protein tyrosine phosphatase family protein [Sulfuricurvum sp.]MDD2830514.1 protein tyrosine phosphatase family protein [Sulfuricurvum sp.]MDD4950652.1 protein tyrosine phosphatase family protein [Sulfuricurvum sp.]